MIGLEKPLSVVQKVKHWLWSGEVAKWLDVLAALAEDLGSVPSTRIVAHNHL